jgi:glycerol-3-phosphate acyltransferase PlsY
VAALVMVAFLVGAVPFAYLAVRVGLGVDIREHGSGNPGATNAARLVPAGWRLLVFLGIFLLDAGKGVVAAGVLPDLAARILPSAHQPAAAPLAGLAAVLGHSFSPFLGFRGGKGVATTLGVLLALEPVATAAALLVFLAVYAWTRVVAAGSLAVAVALPLLVLLRRAEPAVTGLAITLGLLILLRHRDNIGRMLKREHS